MIEPMADVVTRAAESTGGEATGWSILSLIVLTVLGWIGRALAKKYGWASTEATTQKPKHAEEVPAPVPATPEGKLDAATELFRELRARAEKAEQANAAMTAEFERQLEEMRSAHRRQIATMQAEHQQQIVGMAGQLRQLERLLGVPPGSDGPTAPM